MTASHFRIVHVPDDAPHADEQMGSKHKFWYYDEELGHCLYKEARPDTGEDWAEKISAELAALLNLPHAGYELAIWRTSRGMVSQDFVPTHGNMRGEFIPGNQILPMVVPEYPSENAQGRRFPRVPQHTVEAVFDALKVPGIRTPFSWIPPSPELASVSAVFVGYLLLDAWIGNTDRHDENWGFVLNPTTIPAYEPNSFEMTMHLAPTFDHASSLGRNEPDEKRQARLTGTDPGFSVRRYVEKCASALYSQPGDKRPLSTLDAFSDAARRYPAAACMWIDNMTQTESKAIDDLISRIPSERISPVGVNFTRSILELNRNRLLALRREIE